MTEDRHETRLDRLGDAVRAFLEYDLAGRPDDERFLMTRPVGTADEANPPALILVENWFEELKGKVGR